MNVKSRRLQSNPCLDHVIEPLADLICSADRPSDALKTALAALFLHVEQTNSLAREFLSHRDAPDPLVEFPEIPQSSCRSRPRSFDRLAEADFRGTVI